MHGVKSTGNHMRASKSPRPLELDRTPLIPGLPVSFGIMHELSSSRDVHFEPGSPGCSSEVSSRLAHTVFLDSPKEKHVFDINHVICTHSLGTMSTPIRESWRPSQKRSSRCQARTRCVSGHF